MLSRPDVNAEFTANGLTPWAAGPTPVAEVMKADLVKHKTLIGKLRIKLE